MRTAWLAAAVLAAATAVGWQDEESPRSDRLEEMRKYASQMIAGMKQLSDWDTHYGYVMDSLETVYERNGWTTEPDLFSLELSREVSRIPPWEVQERFDSAIDILSDRYVLDPRQEKLLKRIVLRENNALFSRHSDRIMTYAMEAIQTRAAGEPFTAEQVARWAELAEPVFMDGRRSIEKAAREFNDILEPEQQELLQADLEASRHRLDTVESLGREWKAGKWSAADWGLDRDPIQNPDLTEAPAVASAADATPGAADADQNPQAAERPARPLPPVADEQTENPVRSKESPAPPVPDDEWTRYVKEFIARYKLDAEQQQRAWLFHKAAKERGDAARGRFERLTKGMSGEAAQSPKYKSLTEERDDVLGRTFDRLKTRLDSLPTRAQRRAVESEAPAAPAKRPAKAVEKP